MTIFDLYPQKQPTQYKIRCIWCEKQFYTVQDLLAHLKASHDRFLYSTPESKAIDSKMKINTIHIEVRFEIIGGSKLDWDQSLGQG